MHRKEQGFSHVLLFLLFIVIVGAIGFTGLRVYQLQQGAKTKSTTSPTLSSAIKPPSTSQKQATARALAAHASPQAAVNFVADIAQALGTKFRVGAVTQAYGGLSGPTDTPGEIGLHTSNHEYSQQTVPGYDFYVLTRDTTTNLMVFYNDKDLQQIHNVILSQFTASGLKPTTVYTAYTSDGSTAEQPNDFYLSDTLLCKYDDPLANPHGPNNGSILNLSCDTLSDYAAIAVAAEPLANAYLKLHPNERGHITFTMPTIKASKASGYSIVDFSGTPISEGMSYGLFYMHNAQWQFYALPASVKNHSYAPCDLPSGSEVAMAYKGQACAASDGSIHTVQ